MPKLIVVTELERLRVGPDRGIKRSLERNVFHRWPSGLFVLTRPWQSPMHVASRLASFQTLFLPFMLRRFFTGCQTKHIYCGNSDAAGFRAEAAESELPQRSQEPSVRSGETPHCALTYIAQQAFCPLPTGLYGLAVPGQACEYFEDARNAECLYTR